MLAIVTIYVTVPLPIVLAEVVTRRRVGTKRSPNAVKVALVEPIVAEYSAIEAVSPLV